MGKRTVAENAAVGQAATGGAAGGPILDGWANEATDVWVHLTGELFGMAGGSGLAFEDRVAWQSRLRAQGLSPVCAGKTLALSDGLTTLEHLAAGIVKHIKGQDDDGIDEDALLDMGDRVETLAVLLGQLVEELHDPGKECRAWHPSTAVAAVA